MTEQFSSVDGNDNDVERRELALEFEPPFSVPSGVIGRIRALDPVPFLLCREVYPLVIPSGEIEPS